MTPGKKSNTAAASRTHLWSFAAVHENIALSLSLVLLLHFYICILNPLCPLFYVSNHPLIFLLVSFTVCWFSEYSSFNHDMADCSGPGAFMCHGEGTCRAYFRSPFRRLPVNLRHTLTPSPFIFCLSFGVFVCCRCSPQPDFSVWVVICHRVIYQPFFFFLLNCLSPPSPFFVSWGGVKIWLSS